MNARQDEHGPWTVARLLDWTRNFFEQRQVEAPRLCAEILLAEALGCERLQLYTRYEHVPAEEVLTHYRAHVREAAAGRPIAYLVGHKEFFSLDLAVSPDVLIPRPETELLVERTVDLVRGAAGRLQRILELGTGSGCIAVALAKYLPDVQLLASDISAAALEVARRNAERHGVAERLTLREGDLFAPWARAELEPVDLVVSNPPYVATSPDAPVDENVRRYEPHVALFAGADGLSAIRRIIAEAPDRLRAGGYLLLEIGFDQAAAVRNLLAGDTWRDVTLFRDPGGHERVVQAQRNESM